MSRYIDADALKAFIRNRYFQCDMPEEWGNGVMWATSQINYYCNKEAPSIDIVRCKECKHWDTHTMQFAENNLVIARCKQWLQYSRMNGYCHNGERKESE